MAKTSDPFADAAVSSTETSPTNKGGQPRLAKLFVNEFPYKKMSDLEGKECLLHDFKFQSHPEYGDSYKATVSIPEEGEEKYVCFLRGTAILRKLQECSGQLELPSAFKLVKPEGKRYWDFV